MRAGWQTSCSVLLGCLAFSSLLFYTPSFLSGKTIMKRKLSNVPCWTPCKDEQLVCPSCFSWVTQPCYQVWTRLLTLEKNIAGVLEETIIKTNWFLRVALWISVNNLSSHIPLWVSNLFWFVSILIAYCIIGCQLHLTLCDSLDCSPPGFFAHGTSQARILGWVAISYSKEFSQPRDQTHVSCIGNGFFTTEPTGDRTSQVVQWWRSRLPLQETWEMQGKFHGQRSLVGYSPWSHKESDVTEHTQIYFYRKTLSYWKVNVNSGIPFVSQRHWFWFCLPF